MGISRFEEEAISLLQDAKAGYKEYLTDEILDIAIKALEQQRWIPVTDIKHRPPKGVVCLWCNDQGSVFTSAITFCTEKMAFIGKHGYFSRGTENFGNIVAWKPLPKSYKEGE